MQKHEAGAPGQLASGRSALVHAAIRLDPMGARPPGARRFLSTGVRGHAALSLLLLLRRVRRPRRGAHELRCRGGAVNHDGTD